MYLRVPTRPNWILAFLSMNRSSLAHELIVILLLLLVVALDLVGASCLFLACLEVLWQFDAWTLLLLLLSLSPLIWIGITFDLLIIVQWLIYNFSEFINAHWVWNLIVVSIHSFMLRLFLVKYAALVVLLPLERLMIWLNLLLFVISVWSFFYLFNFMTCLLLTILFISVHFLVWYLGLWAEATWDFVLALLNRRWSVVVWPFFIFAIVVENDIQRPFFAFIVEARYANRRYLFFLVELAWLQVFDTKLWGALLPQLRSLSWELELFLFLWVLIVESLVLAGLIRRLQDILQEIKLITLLIRKVKIGLLDPVVFTLLNLVVVSYRWRLSTTWAYFVTKLVDKVEVHDVFRRWAFLNVLTWVSHYL